MKLGISVIL